MVMKRHLTPEQRLDLLRKLDRLRKWNSLDDERVCVVCLRIFSGRHIDIVRDARGRYLLHCPTQVLPTLSIGFTRVTGRLERCME